MQDLLELGAGLVARWHWMNGHQTTPANARASSLDEWASALTHGLGLVLAIAGLVVGVVLAALHGDAWVVTSMAIYGTTLVLLYAASTFYHAVSSPRWRNWLRKCDHAAIFLLIAGTYTPFVLVNLRGAWGWSLFGVVWGLALVGIGFKFLFAGRFVLLSSAIYVLLGWLILIAIKPLFESIPVSAFVLLAAGGLCYTGGVAFYLWRGLRFHHAIWHLFVLAGSLCHYLAVLRSVA